MTLVFLLVGAAFVTGGSVLFREADSVLLRSLAAAAFAPGLIMLVIGLVNAVSGTP